MKLIHRFNLFAIGLPILLGIVGTIFNYLLIAALLSTMLTGLIQVILGIYLLFTYPKDTNLKIYLGTVIAYFIFWTIVGNSHLDINNFIFVFAIIPVVLAIYLTAIIFKKLKS